MKYSHKLSDAVHTLAYLAIFAGEDRSSTQIAASIEANASVVRKLMADLKRAGLILTRPGTADPVLSRKPAEINLKQVYYAVEMNHDLLHVDPKTNPACLVGANIQETLNEAYDQVQAAAEAEMEQITLQMIIDGILARHAAKQGR